MGRNTHLRVAVTRPACGWEGIRAAAGGPCMKCQQPVQAKSGHGGRSFDLKQGTAMKTAEPTLGPRRKGAAHNKDLMRGEGRFRVGGTKKADAKTFQTGAALGGGDFNAQMVGPKKGRMAAVAVPGGPTGPNSAYKRGAKGAKPDIKGGLVQHAHIHKYDGQDGGDASASGTSIFDPVLCEIAYRWFCPVGGTVLDPFAGGSVRGLVASRLGRDYVGIELRPEQVEANQAQLGLADKKRKPDWRVGDSRHIARLAKDVHADLIFSCPPYWNLEVYSEDPADLSTLGKEAFFEAQAQIIRDAVSRLKPDRFAVWVVGDVRDKDGYYANLPGRTVEAFEAAGARFYNDCILVTAVGSLPVRVGKQFTTGRKLGKTHQNVLVFCKGDWRKAVKACGTVEFGDIGAAMAAQGEIVVETPVQRTIKTSPDGGVERFGNPL